MIVIAETPAGGYTPVPRVISGEGFFSAPITVLSELPNDPEFIRSQYDLLAGVYPTDYTQLVLVVDSQNRIDVAVLEALGINVEDDYAFTEMLGKTFKIIPNNAYYTQFGSTFIPSTNYGAMYASEEAIEIEIVGILRVNPDASSELLSTGIGYTTFLTEHMLASALSSNIVVAQSSTPDTNVFTGFAFNDQVTFQMVMRTIGGDSAPTGVQIYPISFDAKDEIKAHLDAFNVGKNETDAIIYIDLAETISSTISGLINTITIVLTAFAAISLVVSSIMIGIITYVSVVERTKEIGIMRSLGARKKDISRIFNAETILIGLTAGMFGILIALVLNIPVNLIIEKYVGVPSLAILTWSNALLLIVLSTVLTLIAGLVPSGIAARKDPVIALRTE